MLSDANIREINSQIDRELRNMRAWSADEDDKANALKNIAALKELLNPHPSRSDILQELADAIINADAPKPTAPQPTLATVLVEILASRRR